MARPKRQYHIEKMIGLEKERFVVYTLNNSLHVGEILSVDGVADATVVASGYISVGVSPLYDIDEVIAEVEALFIPLPPVFQEWSDEAKG